MTKNTMLSSTLSLSVAVKALCLSRPCMQQNCIMSHSLILWHVFRMRKSLHIY